MERDDITFATPVVLSTVESQIPVQLEIQELNLLLYKFKVFCIYKKLHVAVTSNTHVSLSCIYFLTDLRLSAVTVYALMYKMHTVLG